MNHIFSIIWNDVKKCYVVVAEFVGKNDNNNLKCVKNIVVVTAVSAIMPLSNAFSADRYYVAGSGSTTTAPTIEAEKGNGVAVGVNSKITWSKNSNDNYVFMAGNSVVFGIDSEIAANSMNATALGSNNTISGSGSSVAVGHLISLGNNSGTTSSIIGIGTSITGQLSDDILIGNSVQSKSLGKESGKNVLIGNGIGLSGASQYNTIIGGSNTSVNSSQSKQVLADSVLLGYGAGMYDTTAELKGITSLGVNSSVGVNYGVALGNGSVANRSSGVVGYAPSNYEGDKSGIVWKASKGAVSIGSVGTTSSTDFTRQITGLAAGSDLTDAVNVAQLQAIENTTQADIETVKTTAEAAQTTANEAKAAVDTVKSTAEEAKTTAGEAKTTAEAAQTTANEAKAAVDTVKSTAEEAKTTAGEAKTTAEAAQTTANEAKDKSEKAIEGVENNKKDIEINTNNIKLNSEAISGLQEDVVSLNNRVDHLDTKIEKVGAGAAALSALHPLDYDSSAKFSMALGSGTYKGENAIALGAFYRPNENIILSLSSTVGNNNDMVALGVSYKFGGRSNRNNLSRQELVDKVSDLENTLLLLQKEMKIIQDSIQNNK